MAFNSRLGLQVKQIAHTCPEVTRIHASLEPLAIARPWDLGCQDRLLRLIDGVSRVGVLVREGNMGLLIVLRRRSACPAVTLWSREAMDGFEARWQSLGSRCSLLIIVVGHDELMDANARGGIASWAGRSQVKTQGAVFTISRAGRRGGHDANRCGVRVVSW